MSIAEGLAIACLECIPDKTPRRAVRERLEQHGRTLVELTTVQLHAFAGNALALRGLGGRQFLFMSQRALESLTDAQTDAIGAHAEIVAVPVPTIETVGGGSVRCMIAEVHGADGN
jgi:hypothetical protein